MIPVLGDIYKNAGFNDASSHAGRRSLITKLAYVGIDINSISQIAGLAFGYSLYQIMRTPLAIGIDKSVATLRIIQMGSEVTFLHIRP